MNPEDLIKLELTALECERLLQLLSAPIQPTLALITKIRGQAVSTANGLDREDDHHVPS